MNDDLTHIIDLMPTLVEISGAKYPEKYKNNAILPMEGKSLVPLFEGNSVQLHDVLCWEHEGNRAVRNGDWKLVSRFDEKLKKELPWELYNLSSDRSETNDLVAKYPERVKELKQLYSQWAERVHVAPRSQVIKMRKRASAD